MSILNSSKKFLAHKVTLVVLGILAVAIISGFAAAQVLRDDEAIERMPVTVIYMGERTEHLTTEDTPWAILYELGYDVSSNYIIYPWPYGVIELPAEITLTRTSIDYIHDIFEVEHPNFIWQNHAMAYGESRVLQYGVTGIQQQLWEIYSHNGVEASRAMLYDGSIIEMVPQITEVGTRGRPINNRLFLDTPRAHGFTYSRSFVAQATAYDPSIAPGRTPITATGQVARRGIVATDPRVIPMGTRMYITSVDGTWSYGFAVAGDTGGAIRGYIVDLFMCSRAEAIQFGRRQVKIYILD